jgi:hypothetical protein
MARLEPAFVAARLLRPVSVEQVQRPLDRFALLSGAELWLTNVLVFALWYWRLDGGGPTVRERRHEFGSRSFVFPQMQIEASERGRFSAEHWHPRFIDYLFIAFTSKLYLRSDRCPLLARRTKQLAVVQIFISMSIVILLIPRATGVL